MPIYRREERLLQKKRSKTKRPLNLVLLPTTEVMLDCFGRYLELNVAEGNAAADTVLTYNRRLNQYLAWCQANQVTPARAEREDILLFRSYLIKQKKQQPSTIALTLVVIRRFYEACCEKKLVAENPVIGVKPPRSKTNSSERITYLNLSQLKLLLDTVGDDGSLKCLRDLLLIVLMALEGLRSVELWRANWGDVQINFLSQNCFLKVEGKGKIRSVPVREDIVKLLERYKKAREETNEKIHQDSPLIISLSNQTYQKRLSRRGIEYIVDNYLNQSQLKRIDSRQSRSAHSLRHTAGTLALAGGASLREVQELLGHNDPKTTAIYAHLTERYENNPAKGIDVEF